MLELSCLPIFRLQAAGQPRTLAEECDYATQLGRILP